MITDRLKTFLDEKYQPLLDMDPSTLSLKEAMKNPIIYIAPTITGFLEEIEKIQAEGDYDDSYDALSLIMLHQDVKELAEGANQDLQSMRAGIENADKTAAAIEQMISGDSDKQLGIKKSSYNKFANIIQSNLESLKQLVVVHSLFNIKSQLSTAAPSSEPQEELEPYQKVVKGILKELDEIQSKGSYKAENLKELLWELLDKSPKELKEVFRISCGLKRLTQHLCLANKKLFYTDQGQSSEADGAPQQESETYKSVHGEIFKILKEILDKGWDDVDRETKGFKALSEKLHNLTRKEFGQVKKILFQVAKFGDEVRNDVDRATDIVEMRRRSSTAASSSEPQEGSEQRSTSWLVMSSNKESAEGQSIS